MRVPYSVIPDYLRIVELIRHDIAANYCADQCYHSQNQLMRRYNASYGTISKALNELVAEGLIRRVRGSGTYINRLPNTHDAMISQLSIGVLLNGHVMDSDFCPFVADICKYLIKAANQLDCCVQFLPSRLQFPQQWKRFWAKPTIDGLICFNPNVMPQEELAKFTEKMPVVLSEKVDFKLPSGKPISWCDIDTEAGISIGVEHLLKHGCRRIALILRNPKHHPLYGRRLDSYRKALENAGITYDPALVYEADSFSSTAGTAAINALLPAKPDAVLISSASYGISAINAILQHNLQIPGDISVIGCDEQLHYSPAFQCITCIESPIMEFAEVLVNQIIALIHGDSVQGHMLQPHLVQGRSVADKNVDTQKFSKGAV